MNNLELDKQPKTLNSCGVAALKLQNSSPGLGWRWETEKPPDFLQLQENQSADLTLTQLNGKERLNTLSLGTIISETFIRESY
ncbi:hypothetical protein [Thermoleptolyngbya sp. C42_A2020_037]|uniref:hypothetical protein n=1 Tax=Thermoleptolyngbya sp. C42_A2020_037 TaxID=2747799 RepID=UPI0019EA467F|nr:hypothetical protein [Thermoleptolyngbya sp. C42_A2020_037]MBF2086595.1 hypothetical protein [Thermoleptolyngbya sp. C42_A2020_037]